MAIEVPEEIAYVAIVVVVAQIVHLWMGSRVGAARKMYKVPYPAMYAVESENKDAKLFNCVQRGHQNFLEAVPFFLTLLVFAGLEYPKVAAILGLLFLAGRIVYMIGYSSGDPKKRMVGGLGSMIILVALVGCTISFAVQKLKSVKT